MSSQENPRLAEDILPTEIWDECWQYVDIKDMWSIRLVCNVFARTGQMYIYRILHSWSPNSEDVEDRNWDMWCKHFLWSSKRFVVVAAGPFSKYVEEWSFSGIENTRTLNDTNANLRGIGVLIDAYSTALTIFLNCLSLYSNLHTITFTSIKVDKGVYEALQYVPSLQNLALVETNTILRPDASRVSPWPLKRLRIVTNDRHEEDEVVDLSIVNSTCLNTLILHSYEFSQACLQPFIILGEPLKLLTHLSINLTQNTMELFRGTLQLCTALETLEVNDFDYKDSVNIRYPTSFSFLPPISNYHGPAYLAARVFHSSPLKSLSIHSGRSREYGYTYPQLYQFLRPLFNQIPYHLAFVCIDPAPDLFVTFSSIFSHVGSLYICYNDDTHFDPTREEIRTIYLDNKQPFKWKIRPGTTMMGILDRLAINEIPLSRNIEKICVTQADPYSSRVVTTEEQREYLDKFLLWYPELKFFQVGENAPLIRESGRKPWHQVRLSISTVHPM